ECRRRPGPVLGRGRAGGARAMLDVRQVSVNYGESQVLRAVDLAVKAGQLVCLMGRNGGGKTTLLKSIMGLFPVKAGGVHFRDRDVTTARPEVRARLGIGYVPQGREIFPQLTVLENLRVGLTAHPQGRRDVPEEVFTWFPMLKPLLGRRGGMLSG